MFYLIGLGLDVKDISIEGLEVARKCQMVYLEQYTIELPYNLENLEKELKIKIIELSREQVESEIFLDKARQKDIALLVYGSPLAATTHISLILKCKKEKIPFKIFHNASIMDAVAETGLQLYKFGKTASMPAWKQGYQPTSFIDIIKGNLQIKAHTLLLTDIGLDFSEALEQLEKASNDKKLKISKILACSRLGTSSQKIFYEKADELKNKSIPPPFCIIIPSELHFLEEEALRRFKN